MTVGYKWYVRFLGNAYALDFYSEENTEASARGALREWMGVRKLPRGCEIWR